VIPEIGCHLSAIKREVLGMFSTTFVLAAVLNPGGIAAWLIIGLVAGWLAGVIIPGRGFGLVGDLLVGLIGAVIGGLIIVVLVPNASYGFWGSFIVALIGACILVAIIHAIAGERVTR
jgi:uncharacterized membrane protein YeaQ/YmgE (transglycosylase-associated protein family)